MNKSPDPDERRERNRRNNFKRSISMRLGVAGIVGPVMVAILAIAVSLATRGHPFMAMIAGIGVFLALLGAFAGALFARNASQLRGLDGGFLALGGVRRSRFLLSGRHWRGKVAGRQLDAYLFRGPTLEVYLSGDARGRLTAVWPGMFAYLPAGALGSERLGGLDASYGDLDVFPADPTWVRAVLSDPRAQAAVPRLLADDSETGLRFVYVLPDAVLLRIANFAFDDLAPEMVASWVEDLASLAAAAESVRPSEELSPTEAEEAERKARGRGAAFAVP